MAVTRSEPGTFQCYPKSKPWEKELHKACMLRDNGRGINILSLELFLRALWEFLYLLERGFTPLNILEG